MVDVNEFMETGEALQRVWEMAEVEQNRMKAISRTYPKDDGLKEMIKKSQLALSTIEDFIVNNFGED